VGGGVVAGYGPVRGNGKHGIALHQHGAHGNFARGFRTARGFQGNPHEIDVAS
jgi:hypothetical protein